MPGAMLAPVGCLEELPFGLWDGDADCVPRWFCFGMDQGERPCGVQGSAR